MQLTLDDAWLIFLLKVDIYYVACQAARLFCLEAHQAKKLYCFLWGGSSQKDLYGASVLHNVSLT